MPPRPFDYSTEGLQTSPNKQKCPAPVIRWRVRVKPRYRGVEKPFTVKPL